uniref:exonuclease domain-containing protein n=1 Tax=Rhodococcus sp. UFZ-B548 TaxID=2742212 RepID=UPI0015F3E928
SSIGTISATALHHYPGLNCAIGLSVVTGGQITATYSWLCRPPSGLDRFDPGNTLIHGITARDVAGQPTFRQRLGNMLDVVGDLPLIAHNAAFDIGALREASAAESLSWPPLTYGCTLLWSRRQLPGLVNHKLPTVAAALGVDLLRHHDASADATAAAQIAVELIRRAGASSLDTYTNATGMMLGRARVEEVRPPRDTSTTGAPTWVSIATASALPPPSPDADPDHRLFGQTVVITGTLGHLSREEAWSQLAKYGARVNKTVTRRTSILVVGDWVDAAGRPQITEKQLHARRLRAAGQLLVFLDRYELDAMLAGDRTVIVPDLTTPSVIDAYALADDSVINSADRSDPRQQVRGLHYTAWRETVVQLKRDRRYDEALQLILECADVAEHPDNRTDGMLPWGWTENAAIVYRKQKDYAGEVAVLERWINTARTGGHHVDAHHPIALRLSKARALSTKSQQSHKQPN